MKERKLRVYVASSWKNDDQSKVVLGLRAAGHEVYDFRSPWGSGEGFNWKDIDSEYRTWDVEDCANGLKNALAVEHFETDFDAMKWADVCVLVQPCGRSAHMEAGWFAGQGKPVLNLLYDGDPELMWLMGRVCTNFGDVVEKLDRWAYAMFED